MAVQIVMDHSGDRRYAFNPSDADALAEAEHRFKELTGVGFTAAERTGPGTQRVVRNFNPELTETLFYPRLVGG